MSGKRNEIGRAKAGPRVAGPCVVGPGRAGPRMVGPSGVGPRVAGPGRVGPRTVGPSGVGPRVVGPGRVGHSRVGHSRVGSWSLALCAAFAMGSPVLAIDSGRVEGSLNVDGETLELNHSYVLLHDNAEGLLSSTPELRICLTDREIDNDALRGAAFLPVEHMARRDEVRGILMRLDPSRPNEVSTTLLFPADPGHSLMTMTLADKDLWIELGVGDLRVVGHMPDLSEVEVSLGWIDPGLRFDAPLFRERDVSADLEGKEALASPPVDALRARTEAMARGDIDAVRGLSTMESVEKMEAFRIAQGLDEENFKEMMKGAGEMGRAILEQIRRVVVREDHAVVIFETGDDTKQWATLHKMNGVWRSAD